MGCFVFFTVNFESVSEHHLPELVQGHDFGECNMNPFWNRPSMGTVFFFFALNSDCVRGHHLLDNVQGHNFGLKGTF